MTRHLSPEEFIDALEGAGACEAHLRECEICRTELAELRATIAEARNLEAPGPSPLFWDHFSARVKEATSRESIQRGWDFSSLLGWRPLAAISAVILAVAIGVSVRNRPAPQPAEVNGADVVAAVAPIPSIEDDGSWSLVAALAYEMEWSELSLAAEPVSGTADAMIDELTAEQREALARLLQKETGDL